MGDRWPYSCCFVGCCFQDLFNIARSILVQLPSSFFSMRFFSIQVVHPYSSMYKTGAWKKLLFISSDRSDFHITDSLSIAVHAFAGRELMFFSVDKTLFLRHMNLSTSFGAPPFRVEISLLWLKHMYYVLSVFKWRPMLPTASFILWSKDSTWTDVFTRSAMSSASFSFVIVRAMYRVLLAFSSVRPFSFLKSIDALEEFTNRSVASSSFARTPSKIQQIVRICDVVDRFLRKPFWFFLRIFSISGSVRLSSRAL